MVEMERLDDSEAGEPLDENDAQDPEDSSLSAGPDGSPTLEDIFKAFFWLGFRVFGDSGTHVKLLHSEFVDKRRWLGESQFEDIQNFGQSLPGMTSVQTAVALATVTAGPTGGLLAFVLFLWPGFLLMFLVTLFVWLVLHHDPNAMLPALFTPEGPFVPVATLANILSQASVGLAPAALAIICFESFLAAYKFCVNGLRSAMATSAGIATLLMAPKDAPWGLPLLLVLGALVAVINAAYFDLAQKDENRYVPLGRDLRNGTMTGPGPPGPPPGGMSYSTGVTLHRSVVLVGAWAAILVTTLVGRHLIVRQEVVTIFDLFYRAGSIAWGNEYVVLAGLSLEVRI